MCVALPGKIIELRKRTAIVDFSGNQVSARAGLVDVKVGDHVLVHGHSTLKSPTIHAMIQALMKKMQI